MVMSNRRYSYYPGFFTTDSISSSKDIILSAGSGMTVDERWEHETKWLVEKIKFGNERDLVIDYGCGIGRLAKEIKNPVLGVDISPSMIEQSISYVNKSTFSCITPEMLTILSKNGLKVSGAYAVWSLQHVLNVVEVIETLMRVIKPGGLFWLMDLLVRRVPCSEIIDDTFTYLDDGIKITGLIDKWCDLETIENMLLYPDQPSLTLRMYRRRS